MRAASRKATASTMATSKRLTTPSSGSPLRSVRSMRRRPTSAAGARRRAHGRAARSRARGLDGRAHGRPAAPPPRRARRRTRRRLRRDPLHGSRRTGRRRRSSGCNEITSGRLVGIGLPARRRWPRRERRARRSPPVEGVLRIGSRPSALAASVRSGRSSSPSSRSPRRGGRGGPIAQAPAAALEQLEQVPEVGDVLLVEAVADDAHDESQPADQQADDRDREGDLQVVGELLCIALGEAGEGRSERDQGAHQAEHGADEDFDQDARVFQSSSRRGLPDRRHTHDGSVLRADRAPVHRSDAPDGRSEPHPASAGTRRRPRRISPGCAAWRRFCKATIWLFRFHPPPDAAGEIRLAGQWRIHPAEFTSRWRTRASKLPVWRPASFAICRIPNSGGWRICLSATGWTRRCAATAFMRWARKTGGQCGKRYPGWLGTCAKAAYLESAGGIGPDERQGARGSLRFATSRTRRGGPRKDFSSASICSTPILAR